jgi:hypothetical protein
MNPSHAACKTSNTGTMRCIHQHNENIAVLFHWNHYFNGFHPYYLQNMTGIRVTFEIITDWYCRKI